LKSIAEMEAVIMEKHVQLVLETVEAVLLEEEAEEEALLKLLLRM